MNSTELQLFNMIDSARTSNGCAPLQRDSDLTASARSDAASRSKSAGRVNDTGSSMSAAGGDDWSATQAYNQIMTQSKNTVLNCGLTTLAVGFGSYEHCRLACIFGTADRNSWVADFQ
jgi:hypothetical protein